jgi:hypothetical protein
MWNPYHLTTLLASTACYGDSFTLWRRSVIPVRYERIVSNATSSQYLEAVSRLSKQSGILNFSQPYRPPRPVTGIALPFYTPNRSAAYHRSGTTELD